MSMSSTETPGYQLSSPTYSTSVKPRRHHISWILAIIACGIAAMGTIFLGIIFLPVAFIISIVSFVLGIIHRNWLGITLSCIAWVLVIIGAFTLDIDPSIVGLPNPNPFF